MKSLWAAVAAERRVIGVSRSNLVERLLNPRPDAQTVMRQLSAWITHYNEVHPHKAIG